MEAALSRIYGKDSFYGIILVGLFILLYSPIFPEMYKLWLEDSNSSHGLLVPFISLALIWMRREKIKVLYTRTSGSGLLILIVSLAFYILGFAGGVEVLPRLTIVTTIIGLIIFNFGLKYFYALAFPVLFLFFMVPCPVSIVGLVSFPLQLIATKISASIISSLSIPVLRSGNMLYFANSSLEVAEACSGLRSLVSYIMLGALFAYLMTRTLKRKMLMVIVTVPLAFLSNLIRITITGILAHYYGSRVARGFLHEFSGMAIFVFGFIILFILYHILQNYKKDEIQENDL